MARAKKLGAFHDRDTGEVLMELMVPRAEDDPLSVCLRVLTHQLKLKTPDDDFTGGMLGGPFGYGVDFENHIFEMHPDWQGDCTCGATEPIHSKECRVRFDEWLTARNDYGVVPSTDAEREAEIKESMARGMSEMGARLAACGRPWSFERVEEYERDHPPPECICEARDWVERDTHDASCRLEQHCFTFKPSGFVMDWYKYIGRDNEIHEAGEPVSLQDMFSACLASIDAPDLDAAFKAYDAAENEHAEQLKRSFDLFFGGSAPTDDAVAGPSE